MTTTRPPHTDDPSIVTSVPEVVDWSTVSGKLMDSNQRTYRPGRANRDKVKPVEPFVSPRRR
jgi:hypothetical protein